jgi:hypothetical protein
VTRPAPLSGLEKVVTEWRHAEAHPIFLSRFSPKLSVMARTHSNFSRFLLVLAALALWRHEHGDAFIGTSPPKAPAGGPSPASVREREPRGLSLDRPAVADADAPPITRESSVAEEVLAGISVAFSLLSKAGPLL